MRTRDRPRSYLQVINVAEVIESERPETHVSHMDGKNLRAKSHFRPKCSSNTNGRDLNKQSHRYVQYSNVLLFVKEEF